MFSEDFNKFDVYFVFFCFSFLSFLFSLKLNFAFFLILESLKDFPLYLLDIIDLSIKKRKSLDNFLNFLDSRALYSIYK